MVKKHIKGWKIGLEAEMGFPVSEAYSLPTIAKSLVGSDGQSVWKPLPITYGDDGSIQSEGNN